MPNSSGSELNVLLRHVPKIVVSRFLNKPERPRGPESCSFVAAVALFDISGFSSLGSRLSEDERRQSRDTNKNGNNTAVTGSVSTPSSPLAAATSPANSNRPALSIRSSSGTMLHSEPKLSKSRISQPVMPSLPSFSSPTAGNLFSARSSGRRESSVKGDDDSSLADDEEALSPSDKMRQRRMTSSSSTSMSFRHGPKNSVATQGIAVETLTTTLNKSLEPVIDVILKHGGDIIKFAGDALIVMWETEVSRGEATPGGELVYRAVCCALEALQALGAAITSDGNESDQSHLQLLGMHVGIGVSDMTGNHVGGVLNRWEFYLSGDANRQMSFAEENAQKDLIGFLRCYVPGAIVSHLQKGLSLTPCRLNVTVAFVKLAGVVEIADKQTQLQTIHQNLCTIQECAYKAQGMLRQFVIDDKGAVAIVAIGLPPFFHENNESGVKASIGVTTGAVFCGSVGSSARAEYAVVGDSINLSARLMSAAPVGEIYCDDRTHKETKDSVHFRDMLEMTVKGKTEPIQVFPVQTFTQASEAFAASLSETTCPVPYGCSNILNAVPLFGSASKTTSSSDGIGHRALIICGDSGTGKTMLLNHVMQRHSLRCFKGNGDSMDTAVDFHAWRGIAKAMATVTVKVSQNKVRDDHDSDAETSAAERITDSGRLSLQQVTRETLRTLSNWLPYDDSGTAPVETSTERSEGALKSFRQVLFAMISAETSLFLCQQYHITIMDTQVLAFVFERTEGNPGSLIKLLNFMLDAKYIAIEPECNNIVILKDLDEMDTLVPQHIRARVMSIVDSLDALAQAALKLLSINPQPSEEKMVNGVLALLSASHQEGSMSGEVSGIRLKVPRPTWEVPLLRQVRDSLVPCETALLTIDTHNKLFFFNTEEMRLVVYDTMLPSQRKVLHALYAEWLQYAASKSGRDSLTPPFLATISSLSSATNLTAVPEPTKGAPAVRPMPYQQYALLGYHLSQSDNPKDALGAYYLAAEGAMEAKELGFAEDCMHTSSKVLNTHPRVNDLNELETILLRSRIEFIRGTIAVENDDLSLAITHMSYITRLFNRKGSVLRHYSTNVQREGLPVRSAASFTASRRTSLPMSTAEPVPAAPGCFSLLPEGPRLESIQARCIPRLFPFNNIFPSSSRVSGPLGRRQLTAKSRMSLRSRSNRIQAEQTLDALDQIKFYRRKASALIKQINYAKKKQDEMHRHIQKFAQRSLQTKEKR
uniref:Guanylate cyclase domain-containing protein n=1 Tax=Phytophthora ramorum TaxID=164328 RepID=H3GKI0_PHYRM